MSVLLIELLCGAKVLIVISIYSLATAIPDKITTFMRRVIPVDVYEIENEVFNVLVVSLNDHIN